MATAPRIDGFQLQVAMMLGDEPVVNLFLHPLIITFLALKVTFDATDTFAVMVTTCLKVAAPLRVSELKDEGAAVTVKVNVLVAFPEALVAVIV